MTRVHPHASAPPGDFDIFETGHTWSDTLRDR
jgi:hypothetical protein